MRTARQRAASRRNLAVARSKRRRRARNVAIGVGAVGVAGAGVVFGSKLSGHPVNVKNYSPPKAVQTVRTASSPHRVRSSAFKKANYPHTPEAKRVAARRYKHTNSHTRFVSEAEALRRTGSYTARREVNGRQISARERTSALRKYRGQVI